MTAGPAETTHRAAPCPESALTRPSSRGPLQRRAAHHISARQRVFCPSRRLRHASGSPDAGDDPVNEADPSGLWTVGYCGGAAAAFLGPKGFANACLTRVVGGGPDEIGAVETAGGGGPKLIIGGGVQVVEQFSNADSLSELTGPFAYWELDVQDDVGEGGSVVVFTGTAASDKSIFGIEVGAGLDLQLWKKFPAVPVIVGGGADYSWAQVFRHIYEWLPADGAWDGMGISLGQPPVHDELALAGKLLNEIARQLVPQSSGNSGGQSQGPPCPIWA